MKRWTSITAQFAGWFLVMILGFAIECPDLVQDVIYMVASWTRSTPPTVYFGSHFDVGNK